MKIIIQTHDRNNRLSTVGIFEACLDKGLGSNPQALRSILNAAIVEAAKTAKGEIMDWSKRMGLDD